jgi:hypothetical protein
MSSAAEVFEMLKTLPPPRIAEVADFVAFLKLREETQRSEAARRLGAAMQKLDALDLPPMNPEEVQAEIVAARRERMAARASGP